MSKPMIQLARRAFLWIFCGAFFGVQALPTLAADTPAPVHGLWVWGTLTVIKGPRSAETLRDFCQSEGINEVYVSVSELKGGENQFAGLIALLHQSKIQVEALLGSKDADEPGPPREKLLDHLREIIQFNQTHPMDRFDGLHLDIEPQQRPENYGPDNLRFLPRLIDAYRAARQLAEPARMTVNADIPIKVLKGDLSQRRMLLSALPRLTLMLYQLSSPGDGESADKKAEKLRTVSARYLKIAYEGLDDPSLAKLSIGLRTPDYGDLLPRMFKTLDEAYGANPHYLGWARHSYNDYVGQAATP